MPDVAAISRIKAEGSKGGSPGFNTVRLQVTKPRMQKLSEGGKLNFTPRSRAGGECSGHAHLRALRADPTPVRAVRQKGQNKDSVSAGQRRWLPTIMRQNGRGPWE